MPGKDGVHPGWAGQVIMAYAFLDALGVRGDLGTITLDLSRGSARTTGRHQVLQARPGQATLLSTSYPFCAPPADLADDGSIRSGMQ